MSTQEGVERIWGATRCEGKVAVLTLTFFNIAAVGAGEGHHILKLAVVLVDNVHRPVESVASFSCPAVDDLHISDSPSFLHLCQFLGRSCHGYRVSPPVGQLLWESWLRAY